LLRLCPRTPISGGKPLKKRRNGLGANRISAVLRMAATSLERSKTALGASFHRIARHKGGAVAVFASARQELAARQGQFSRLTRSFNGLGLPALSVPCGFSRDGLPLALQIVGRPFDERIRAVRGPRVRTGGGVVQPSGADEVTIARRPVGPAAASPGPRGSSGGAKEP
jgi:hypothetical protein